MHDPLESALRARRPAAPDAALTEAIARRLDPAHPRPAVRTSRSLAQRLCPPWLPWGVAAAMTVAFLSRLPERPTADAAGTAKPTDAAPAVQQPVAAFTPISTTNTLVGALDEGVVILDDGRPARKLRLEFLDTVKLQGQGDSGAVVNVTYPREEIRLLPVQTL